MTNHIEELMQAAGVVPVHLTDCSFINIRKGYDVGTDCCPAVEDERLKCEDCEHSKETQLIYPAFTPAKQLELIKLVLKKPYIEWEQYFENNKFIMKADMPDETYACLTIDVENTEYALALAEFITELLKIKRLDKSEVKRILKDV